ncbi:hypothetical protein KSF78_0009580 [Schistosoma japonicum]|nr:hypothetical protein KSF78_0009580 [Schistosoma japonicum]
MQNNVNVIPVLCNLEQHVDGNQLVKILHKLIQFKMLLNNGEMNNDFMTSLQIVVKETTIVMYTNKAGEGRPYDDARKSRCKQ